MTKGGDGYITTYIINHANIKDRKVREKNHFLEVLANDLTKPVTFSSGAIWREVEGKTKEDMSLMHYRMSHELSHPIKSL